MTPNLLPHASLRVAVAVSAAPGAFWASRDAQGHPFGVSIDLAKALAERLGAPLELVEFPNSSEITAAAAHDKWDVTFIPMDDDRAKKIDFGAVYNIAESTFLVRPGLDIKTVQEVDKPGIRIAAVADTTTMRACSAWAKEAAIIGFSTIDLVLAALKSGAADAFAMSRDGLTTMAKEIPGSKVLPGQFFGAKTALATPQGRTELLTAANAFLEAAKADGTVRRIFDAHGMQGSPVAP